MMPQILKLGWVHSRALQNLASSFRVSVRVIIQVSEPKYFCISPRDIVPENLRVRVGAG